MVWTHYDTPKQLRDELDTYLQKLIEGDIQPLDELKVMFLAIMTFQELPISNGCPDDYLDLAARPDTHYSAFKGHC